MPLNDVDRPLVQALGADGRRIITDLAHDTGVSSSTMARRLDALRTSNTMFFDVDMDDAALGVTAKTRLWISVANELSTHPTGRLGILNEYRRARLTSVDEA